MSDQAENTTPEAAEETPQATTPPKTDKPIEDLGRKTESEIRDFIARLVGATPDDDWDTIGRMVDANFRGRIAGVFKAKPAEEQEEASWEDIRVTIDGQLRETLGGWAGAEKGDDWRAVGEKMDTKIRDSVGGTLGKTKKPSEEVEVVEEVKDTEEAPTGPDTEPATWEEAGGDIERNIRKEVGRWVSAEPDANWESIGDLFADKFRSVFSGVKGEDAPAPGAKTQVPISDDEKEAGAETKAPADADETADAE